MIFIIINDFDKDLVLTKDVFKIISLSSNVINYNKIVYKVVKTNLILYIRRLNLKYKEELFLDLKLDFIFNDEQFIQIENVLENLENLLKIKDYRHVFDFKFLKKILNIIEIVDYFDFRYTKMMTKSIIQIYLTTHKIVFNIIKDRTTLRKKYDIVLTRRIELLIKKKFRQLFIKNVQEYVLFRMFLIN